MRHDESIRCTRRPGSRSRALALGLSAWLALACGDAARAQEGAGETGRPAAASAPAPTPEPQARPAEMETEIARLEALRQEWATRAAGFAQARSNAPESLAAIEAEIAGLQRGAAPPPAQTLGSAELEAELVGSEQDLAVARQKASDLEAEAAGRTERRRRIPELLATAKQRLSELEGAAPPASESVPLDDARARLARLRREVIEREIEAYEEELKSYESRGQLLTRRRDLAALRIAALEARVTTLQDALSERRQRDAEAAAEESLRSLEAAEGMSPAVVEIARSLAAENRALALERSAKDGLLERIDDTSRKVANADAQVAAVNADLERLRRRVEGAGLSGSTGLLLRRTRAAAPDVGKYRRFIRLRRDQIAEVQARQIELLEQREALANVDEAIKLQLAEIESALSPPDRAAAEAVLRDLLETQRRYLDTAIADTETYFQKLVDLDARQQELVTRTEALLHFVDEQVMWLPSGEALPKSLASDARDALAWLLTPRFWGQLARAIGASATGSLTFVLGLLLLLAGPTVWPRVRARLLTLGEEADRPSCTRIEPTLEALGLSLLLATWAPGLLAFLGWRLGSSSDATQFVRCFAQGLVAAAFVWGTLEIPRQVLRRRGLAAAHLGWPEAPTRALRAQLGWLAALAVPAVFLIQVFEERAEPAWGEALGRFAFLLAMAGVLAFAHLALREPGGSLRRAVSARPELRLPTWGWRALHAGALMLAFALAVAAARGYYWTALQLAQSLHITALLLFVVLVAYQLGTRWSLLASHRLALERWRSAETTRQKSRDSADDAPALEAPDLDLATVDAHTSRLLRNGALLAALLGLWVVWADLLPAAGALRSVELWTTTTTTTVELKSAAGERLSSIEERIAPVTLADLLFALVVATMTVAVARNLPGLLEISLLRRFEASAGERYAYATLGKYLVTIAGVALVFRTLGVGWSNLQWLVAAVGLGLGFGLQEIFANFVSGLIILFERPIRVGDTVTVGDISGTVSKIRIRATWITGFDRKELVVPNKEFITSRLVNWSLSDAVLRVEVPVGIAYGSDTEKAIRVLEEVAERNENVLKEPKPYALFRGFGESSLDFELRVFSPDVAHYLRITHELHMQIDRAFRAENIEIAFPQRDLHLRSVPIEDA